MKFNVDRTSIPYEQQPCPEAQQEKCLRVDRRTCKTPEEHDTRYPGKPWSSEGLNHRQTETGIERDVPSEAWFISIDDLAGLMAFVKKYGECIINSCSWAAKDHPSIEIYDDYRE